MLQLGCCGSQALSVDKAREIREETFIYLHLHIYIYFCVCHTVDYIDLTPRAQCQSSTARFLLASSLDLFVTLQQRHLWLALCVI